MYDENVCMNHIRGQLEKQREWVCYVGYGRKRDKQIVLSSNMISWEFIIVILAFCNYCIYFIRFSLHLFFFKSFSYQH